MADDLLDIDAVLSFTLALARRAGALLVDNVSSVHQVGQKGGRELVTEVDMASERLIVGALSARFPDWAIESEEGLGQERHSPYRWIVDPLDGTNNYAHGYPHFCLSIALWRERVPLLGVVYDPVRGECFRAARGQGAFCNDRPIEVSQRAALTESLVSTGFPYGKATRPDNNVAEFSRLALQVQGIRRSGVAALDLCYVAAGRQEAHWELGLKPWDVAAGGLVVLEAGGQVTGPGRCPWNLRDDRLVASNGRVHDVLLALLGWDTPL